MADAQTEPFVVVWAPKDRDEQPELYDALKRLIEPEMLVKIMTIATKYGVPGFEFQLFEIDEEGDDRDGLLALKVCFDHSSIDPKSEALGTIRSGIKELVALDLPMILDEYIPTGSLRIYHDSYHVRQYDLAKLHDSRPTLSISRED
jgi:hypothetical protein